MMDVSVLLKTTYKKKCFPLNTIDCLVSSWFLLLRLSVYLSISCVYVANNYLLWSYEYSVNYRCKIKDLMYIIHNSWRNDEVLRGNFTLYVIIMWQRSCGI